MVLFISCTEDAKFIIVYGNLLFFEEFGYIVQKLNFIVFKRYYFSGMKISFYS